MIKGIMFFIFVWLLVAMGITVFRGMTLREKISMAKLVVYSGITAIVALAIVIIAVIAF